MSRQQCTRCTRPASHCLCASIPTLVNRTRVLVLQHPDEARHPLNTARLAVLGLTRARLTVGEVFDPALWESTPSWLLFPGDEAIVLDTDAALPVAPVQLVVPDGTWRHARRLLRLNPGLGRLPRCSLDAPPPSGYRVRRASEPGALATVEAIALALNRLDAPARFEALCEPLQAMVDGQRRAMAKAGKSAPARR